MSFTAVTLNLARDEKRWEERSGLIAQEIARVQPDIITLNEISLKWKTGRWLQKLAKQKAGISYGLVQACKPNNAAQEAEGILTKYPIVEATSFDYCSENAVAQVVRCQIEGQKVDVYVTHLKPSTVSQLLGTSCAER